MKISRLHAIIALLALCIILIGIGFNCVTAVLSGPSEYSHYPILLFILFTAGVAIWLALILTRNILWRERQEQIVKMQDLHIEQLKEMMRVIKTQRHDFIDHLQTVYGLMKLGEVEQAQNHIANLCQDVKISGEVLRIAIPEVTALLMVKAGVAASRNISVNVDVRYDLSGLKIRPLDIVAVLGNLLNNAIEAVEELEISDRQVELRIFEDATLIVFQTHNPGFIPEEIQKRLFEPGITTKTGPSHRGLGLASINHLVEKYKGKLSLVSDPEQGTTFTVCFPE